MFQARDGSKGSPRAGAGLGLWGLLPTAQIIPLDKERSTVGKRRGNSRKDSKGADKSLTPKINHILSLSCLWQELGHYTINDGEGYQVFNYYCVVVPVLLRTLLFMAPQPGWIFLL